MSSSEPSPLRLPGGLTPNSLCKDARRCSSVGWCRSGFERPVGEMDIVPCFCFSRCCGDDATLASFFGCLAFWVSRRASSSSCPLEGKLFVLTTRKPREQSLWMKALRLNKAFFPTPQPSACVLRLTRTPKKKKLSLPLVSLPV